MYKINNPDVIWVNVLWRASPIPMATIPKVPKIAEICGVITGDGHLSRYISPKRTDYRVEVFGDKTEEVDYFQYLFLLFQKSLGRTFKIKIKKDCIHLYKHSKEILEFFEEIGIIVGKKSDKARIPKLILNDPILSLKFLRGLADTDFSMCFKKGARRNNSYPRICAEFASQKMIKDIQIILDRIGITYCKQKVIRHNLFGVFIHYRLQINGRKNLSKWMNLIGFSNPKHLTKIKVWKNLGYCPPRTTYSERLKIINRSRKINLPTS